MTRVSSTRSSVSPTRSGSRRLVPLSPRHSVLIADGHHRYAIARSYRDERRGDDRPDPAPRDLTLAYVSELVEGQLSVDAIHRLYRGMPGWDQLLDASRTYRSITCRRRTDRSSRSWLETIRSRRVVSRPGVRTETACGCTPRPEAFVGVRHLDGVLLEHALDDVGCRRVCYQHGIRNVVDAVASGAVDCRRADPADEHRGDPPHRSTRDC